ncbi:MAG: hypothetical protein KKE17_15745 [Proteobacteria bacterium]|nr:hypothetical protein [Pseudomonadota bacterium]MBU1901898.1 hypothetical protein [Patescibacteria group bacterium]
METAIVFLMLLGVISWFLRKRIFLFFQKKMQKRKFRKMKNEVFADVLKEEATLKNSFVTNSKNSIPEGTLKIPFEDAMYLIKNYKKRNVISEDGKVFIGAIYEGNKSTKAEDSIIENDEKIEIENSIIEDDEKVKVENGIIEIPDTKAGVFTIQNNVNGEHLIETADYTFKIKDGLIKTVADKTIQQKKTSKDSMSKAVEFQVKRFNALENKIDGIATKVYEITLSDKNKQNEDDFQEEIDDTSNNEIHESLNNIFVPSKSKKEMLADSFDNANFKKQKNESEERDAEKQYKASLQFKNNEIEETIENETPVEINLKTNREDNFISDSNTQTNKENRVSNFNSSIDKKTEEKYIDEINANNQKNDYAKRKKRHSKKNNESTQSITKVPASFKEVDFSDFSDLELFDQSSLELFIKDFIYVFFSDSEKVKSFASRIFSKSNHQNFIYIEEKQVAHISLLFFFTELSKEIDADGNMDEIKTELIESSNDLTTGLVLEAINNCSPQNKIVNFKINKFKDKFTFRKSIMLDVSNSELIDSLTLNLANSTLVLEK